MNSQPHTASSMGADEDASASSSSSNNEELLHQLSVWHSPSKEAHDPLELAAGENWIKIVVPKQQQQTSMKNHGQEGGASNTTTTTTSDNDILVDATMPPSSSSLTGNQKLHLSVVSLQNVGGSWGTPSSSSFPNEIAYLMVDLLTPEDQLNTGGDNNDEGEGPPPLLAIKDFRYDIETEHDDDGDAKSKTPSETTATVSPSLAIRRARTSSWVSLPRRKICLLREGDAIGVDMDDSNILAKYVLTYEALPPPSSQQYESQSQEKMPETTMTKKNNNDEEEEEDDDDAMDYDADATQPLFGSSINPSLTNNNNNTLGPNGILSTQPEENEGDDDDDDDEATEDGMEVDEKQEDNDNNKDSKDNTSSVPLSQPSVATTQPPVPEHGAAESPEQPGALSQATVNSTFRGSPSLARAAAAGEVDPRSESQALADGYSQTQTQANSQATVNSNFRGSSALARAAATGEVDPRSESQKLANGYSQTQDEDDDNSHPTVIASQLGDTQDISQLDDEANTQQQQPPEQEGESTTVQKQPKKRFSTIPEQVEGTEDDDNEDASGSVPPKNGKADELSVNNDNQEGDKKSSAVAAAEATASQTSNRASPEPKTTKESPNLKLGPTPPGYDSGSETEDEDSPPSAPAVATTKRSESNTDIAVLDDAEVNQSPPVKSSSEETHVAQNLTPSKAANDSTRMDEPSPADKTNDSSSTHQEKENDDDDDIHMLEGSETQLTNTTFKSPTKTSSPVKKSKSPEGENNIDGTDQLQHSLDQLVAGEDAMDAEPSFDTHKEKSCDEEAENGKGNENTSPNSEDVASVPHETPKDSRFSQELKSDVQDQCDDNTNNVKGKKKEAGLSADDDNKSASPQEEPSRFADENEVGQESVEMETEAAKNHDVGKSVNNPSESAGVDKDISTVWSDGKNQDPNEGTKSSSATNKSPKTLSISTGATEGEKMEDEDAQETLSTVDNEDVETPEKKIPKKKAAAKRKQKTSKTGEVEDETHSSSIESPSSTRVSSRRSRSRAPSTPAVTATPKGSKRKAPAAPPASATRSKRRKESQLKVFVTGISDLTKTEKKMPSKFGGVFVDREDIDEIKMDEDTVVIASNEKKREGMKRTPKLMAALCCTSNIVDQRWLVESSKKKSPEPFENYIVRDEKFEDQYNISLSDSITRSRTMRDEEQRRLLSGYSVYIIEGVAGKKKPYKTPPLEEFRHMIAAAGGEYCEQASQWTKKEKRSGKCIIITSKDPVEEKQQLAMEYVSHAKEHGAKLMNTATFFDAFVRQSLPS